MKLEKTNIIYGKMDSGKTRGILFKEVEEIIKKQENLLILDLKEEYYKNYIKELKNNNYEVVTINLKQPLKSNNYNPYTMAYTYYKSNDIDNCISLLEKIGRILFKQENKNADPFWENSAKDLFIGLSLILFKEGKEDEINFGSISALLNVIETEKFNSYFKSFNVTDPIYISASGTLCSPIDTKGSIISVFKQKINYYVMKPNLLQLMSNTSFEINNFGNKKTALFIILKDEKSDINNIANMLIEQLVFKVKENKTNLNLILDNIDSINELDSLGNLIDMAYDNIKLSVATRNLDLLKSAYGEENLVNIMNLIDAEKEDLEVSEITNEEVNYPTLNGNSKFFDIKRFKDE